MDWQEESGKERKFYHHKRYALAQGPTLQRRRGRGAITSILAAHARHIHCKKPLAANAPWVGRIRWRHKGHHNDHEEAERRRDHHGRIGLEVGMGRPEEDEGHEEVESYTCYDGSNNRRGEEASDDGTHHDGDYSHVEVVHGRSSHQKVDNRLDGKVVESVSGSVRCVGPLPGSAAVSRSYHMGQYSRPYISYTTHVCTLEFLVVQFVHSELQVCCRLELYESSTLLAMSRHCCKQKKAYPLPSRSRPTSE